jgi:uncharacterized membrane protein
MGQKCSCMHHKMVPMYIILIGLIFLLNGLGILSGIATGILWPIVLILIGLQKIVGRKCPCCQRGPKPAEAPKS